MTSAKQARHSHFQRGSGVFACAVCQRQARDTGDNGALGLCTQCFEIAGYENTLSDQGSLSPSEAAVVRGYFNELAQHLGSHAKARATAEEIYDLVFITMPQAPVEEKPAKKSKKPPVTITKPEPLKLDGMTNASVTGGTEEPEEPAADSDDPEAYLVVIHNADLSVAELIAVCAPASRFARRYAKAEWKAMGNQIEGFEFHARSMGRNTK